MYPKAEIRKDLPALLINGANNAVSSQYAKMQILTAYYDRPVIGIHNGAATSVLGELMDTIPENNRSINTRFNHTARDWGKLGSQRIQ